MMNERRKFLKNSVVSALGLGVLGSSPFLSAAVGVRLEPVKVGIIGLDTSHSIAFASLFNDPAPAAELSGFKVVAAYPHGSRDIQSSLKMIPPNIAKAKQLGIEIVDSIAVLLSKCEVVLLETNDGRLHLEQALEVIKAGKKLFIDKPVAASLKDTLAIFRAAKRHGVPVFSSSSLRFMESAQQVVKGKIGQVTGAEAYSPALIESSHPDLFWYGIHGVETLFTLMGKGCVSVSRTFTGSTDYVVGVWEDGRIGTFRGIRNGRNGYGGTAFGTEGIAVVGPFEGYRPLVVKIAEFFRTGSAPVDPEETLQIVAFMEAAELSKSREGETVRLAEVFKSAGS